MRKTSPTLVTLWKNLIATGRVVFVLLFIAQATTPPPVWAAFEDNGVGARAPGMADTFTGVADDANALYYNPAGLTQVKQDQVSTHYGQLLRGTSDDSSLGVTYLGFAHPFRRGEWGTLGLAFHQFKAANLLKERMIILSYGWMLNKQPFGWSGQWSIGANLKQLHRSYEPDRFTENALNDAGVGSGQGDPLFAKDGRTTNNYALDLATLYKFGAQHKYSVGIMAMNINQPDISLGGDGDKPPFITKLGVAYRPIWGVISAEVRRAKRLTSQSDTDVAFGLERRFPMGEMGTLALRGGYAEGSRNLKEMTAGASYQLGRGQLDYAFIFPLGNLSDTQGSHRIGFSMKVGAGRAGELEESKRSDVDLISSFRDDSLASYAIYTRITIGEELKISQRLWLLQLISRKYAIDSPGMADVRKEMVGLTPNQRYQNLDWPTLKATLLRQISRNDVLNAEDALEHLAKNDSHYALARMALLDPTSRADEMVMGIELVALAELAAQAYRAHDIDSCIDRVRQMIDILPEDKVIDRAYRELLKKQMVDAGQIPQPPSPVHTLPEAPSVLVAPHPVVPVDQTTKEQAQHDAKVKNFGETLGYYFNRKAQGASPEELKTLLDQMKSLYSNIGIDMSLVNKELKTLETTSSQRVAAPEPAVPAVAFPATAEIEMSERKTNMETATNDFHMILDYYFQRKAAGASVKEREHLLKLLKTVYGGLGLDMTLINKEAAQLAAARKETIKPVVRPSSVSPKKTERPLELNKSHFKEVEKTLGALESSMNADLRRSWNFYRAAVERGVTEHERIELLENILIQFGEISAPKVNDELERMRKRLSRR